MALTLIGTNDWNTVKDWSEDLVKEMDSTLDFAPFIGGEDKLITEKEELQRGKGDELTIPMRYKNVGQGVVGDVSVMDKLQNVLYAADKLRVDQVQYPFVAPNDNTIMQQRVSFNLLENARANMLQQNKDNFNIGFFVQMSGYTGKTIYVDGREAQYIMNGGDYMGMNPVQPPSADRWYAANQSSEDKLTANDKLTLPMIDFMVKKAQIANPVFGRIEGLYKGASYIMFVHPSQEEQLRTDAQWTEITKYAYMGEGQDKSNPIFGGILGIYHDTLLVRSRYVCQGVDSSGNPLPNTRRAIFCGAQAMMYARASTDRKNDRVDIFMDATIDGGNRSAVIAKRIYGMKKTVFNREGAIPTMEARPDFACMVLSTYADDDANTSGAVPVQNNVAAGRKTKPIAAPNGNVA